MEISLLMTFLNIAIFVVACALLFLAFPLRRLAAGRWLLVLVGSFCVISFFSLNVFAQNSFELKTVFSRLRFLGFALLGPSWLLFLSSHYNRWSWLRKNWVVVLLFLPGLCTISFSLTSGLEDLIVRDFRPVEVYGMSVVQFRAGPWFQVHYLWTLFLTGLSLVLGALVFFRRSSHRADDHRRQIVALMIGVVLSVAVDIYCVVVEPPLRWVMLSGGTFLLTEVALAFAGFRYRLFAQAVSDMNNVYMNMPDPVLLADAENRLRHYNRAAATAFDLSPRSIGERCEAILPGWPMQAGDLSLEDRAGQLRHYDFSLRDIGQGDFLQGRILFFREVTAHKENEKQIRESLEFKAQLMALLTHDMSGHMHNQVVLTQFLSQASAARVKEISETLVDSAVTTRNLVVGLLNWARTQEGAFAPVMKAYEVNSLLLEIAEELEAQFKGRGVHLELVTHPQPIMARGDSQMLGCVARNFLTNALQASSPNKKVVVRVQLVQPERRFRVVIEDEGQGMSEDQLMRLRTGEDLFLNSGSSKKKGYGIGFKLARKFIEIHRGDLMIESQLGRGTQVSYSIPI